MYRYQQAYNELREAKRKLEEAENRVKECRRKYMEMADCVYDYSI